MDQGRCPERKFGRWTLDLGHWTFLFLLTLASPFPATRADDKASAQPASDTANDPAEALFLEGRAYANGEGRTQDFAKAAELYRKAAEQGNAKAQNNLAWLYIEGKGMAKDAAEGLKWLRKAAEQGTAKSQDSLGYILTKGQGVPKDAKEGVLWLTKAAGQGVARAQAQLGLLHFFGDEGVPQDYALAAKWLTEAAKQGHADAQNTMGVLYQNGWGTFKSDGLALIWWMKAADQQHAKAQASLGQAIALGHGTDRDPVTGYMWVKLAKDAGEATGEVFYEEFVKGLTKEQIAAGEKMVAEYRAKKGLPAPAVRPEPKAPGIPPSVVPQRPK